MKLLPILYRRHSCWYNILHDMYCVIWELLLTLETSKKSDIPFVLGFESYFWWLCFLTQFLSGPEGGCSTSGLTVSYCVSALVLEGRLSLSLSLQGPNNLSLLSPSVPPHCFPTSRPDRAPTLTLPQSQSSLPHKACSEGNFMSVPLLKLGCFQTCPK